jgi:hypothetical protein
VATVSAQVIGRPSWREELDAIEDRMLAEAGEESAADVAADTHAMRLLQLAYQGQARRLGCRRVRVWLPGTEMFGPSYRMALLTPDRTRARVWELHEHMIAGADLAGMVARCWERLHRMVEHDLLPGCVVPGCERRGEARLVAAADGPLAGRQWRQGEEIRLCPAHYHDVVCAVGALTRTDLAEWLRADPPPGSFLDEVRDEAAWTALARRSSWGPYRDPKGDH